MVRYGFVSSGFSKVQCLFAIATNPAQFNMEKYTEYRFLNFSAISDLKSLIRLEGTDCVS